MFIVNNQTFRDIKITAMVTVCLELSFLKLSGLRHGNIGSASCNERLDNEHMVRSANAVEIFASVKFTKYFRYIIFIKLFKYLVGNSRHSIVIIQTETIRFVLSSALNDTS
jgi:hypothetical protein